MLPIPGRPRQQEQAHISTQPLLLLFSKNQNFGLHTYADMDGTCMTASSRDLNRLILETVSEDYQSFETVASKLSRVDAVPFSDTDIERILLASIADKFVSAFLIHADPPYATEVEAEPETIRRYWFCITDQGRNYLDCLLPAQAGAPPAEDIVM